MMDFWFEKWYVQILHIAFGCHRIKTSQALKSTLHEYISPR